MTKIAFICDGYSFCNRSESCYRNGGDCHHTENPEHALHLKGTATNRILSLTFKENVYGDFMEVDEN